MMVNSMSRVYRWTYDEALRHSSQNALAIRRDPVVMDALRSRQIPVAQLPWEIECEDDTDTKAADACKLIKTIIKDIPRLQQLLMHLEEAIWFGRYGVQQIPQWDFSTGQKLLKIRDHRPINGDKLVFRWSGEAGVLVHAAYKGDWQVTDRGRAHFFTPREREQLIIHRYEPEDADFFEGEIAGGINGVGIRSRIYWLWYLRQQVTSFLMDYLERVGAGGFTIYYYEHGNSQSLADVKAAAEDQWRNNAILFPRYKDKSTGGPGVERIEPSTAGATLLQSLIMEYFDNIIRRYILGQSLTSEQSSGGGLGDGVAGLHASTFARLVKYDAVNLQETLTSDLVAVLQKYNAPKVTQKLKWVFNVDKPNAAEILEAAQTFYEMGGTVDEDELRQGIGLSKPQPGNSMLAKFQSMSPAATGAVPAGVPMLGPPGPLPVSGGDPGAAGGQPPVPTPGTVPQPIQQSKRRNPFRFSKVETPEQVEAREASEQFKAGKLGLYEFLSKQPPGFRHEANGKKYVNSFDRGPMVLNKVPLDKIKGSAIGQTKYDPKTIQSYHKFLLDNPEQDTEGIVGFGSEDGYAIHDGHHRVKAYRLAGRTHIPMWQGFDSETK